jgi:hypothetical protein
MVHRPGFTTGIYMKNCESLYKTIGVIKGKKTCFAGSVVEKTEICDQKRRKT